MTTDLPTEIQLPPGARAFMLACSHCGTAIETYTPPECDLSNPVVAKFVDDMIARFKWLCRACKNAFEGEHAKEQRWRKSNEWAKCCPIEFRQTVINRLPCQRTYIAVMRWIYQPRGLVLVGKKGKSRCGWKLVEREFLNGKSVAIITSNFGSEILQRNGISSDTVNEFVEELAQKDIALIDDPIKSRFPEIAETALLNIVKFRTQHQLPMIITASDLESLESQMSPDRGPALTRRIREFCEIITFN